MESSRTAATSTNGTEKSRRRNTDYLQIDPSSTFINNTGRGFAEELPENFLDTISPHPITPSASTSSATSATEEPATSSAPQLASLAPMSMSSEQPSSSFSSASLLSSSYETIKNEPEFSGSTAGLLSPLHVDSRRRESHDFNTSPYIKEEEDLDGSHLLMGGIRPDTPTNDRSTDLGSISSLLNEDHHTNTIGQSPSPRSTFGSDPTPMIQRQLIKNEDGVSPGSMGFSKNHQGYQKPRNGDRMEYEKAPYQRNSRKQKKPLGLLNQALSSVISTPTISSSNIPTPPSAHIAQPRRIYSTQDSNDPLNAEIGDDIYIDTKDLCKRIAFELKNHSIPQAIFAERILCRSQGTLSDLLRNPKPWNKLKSGRETFRRMYNWVAQPLATRLAILDMKTEDVNRASGMSPPTPAQNVRTHRRSTSDHDGPVSKRPRLVFTDIQKRTLQAIFKETQRPSREMQQTIAEHLRLDLSTVANFFMNARRRSRLGGNIDEPTPFQQVKNISPPPVGDTSDALLNGDDHVPLLNTVMAEMYKEGAIATSNHSAEQREMIERGFGVSIPGPSHSGELLNGDSHEDDEELDELNDSELAYEEDVEIGDEEEEDEEQANGDILPTPKVEELEEKTVIKEEAPDDGEYGATKLAAN
ncbi:Homeobox protein ceh-38 [Caenorhabditis elegans]|uniref:Homeobox protein ceh-38 n=1 Tax=Caenorhabditis elegans TaxID=6239 RepID=HM38_CAEEL|nr:Homeobox protein ceh-38 [Caenorhabditis elegans]Q19720.2 RecName: Full=Homeobox protein ceh-38 [Caenorhabditis elegans]CCD61547.1 Homeobox protein ceh-38 [Caenorhabditis elegans]|eukprot:NP_741017.1 Homeobox protein ceh-38 [Caenorhabditis elegans]